MIDVRIKNIEDSDADTLLSEDVDFQGNMNLSRPAMIKGQVTGKIESVSNVFIEKGSDVKADVKAQELSVKGALSGTVQASAVELGSSAVFNGDITAQNLAMESGCTFSGTSRIGNNLQPAEQPDPEE